MRTLVLSTQRDVHSIELKIISLRMLLKSDSVYLHCSMHPSADPAECIYSTILIFKLNSKHLGLQ